jgi:hypothetical protein
MKRGKERGDSLLYFTRENTKLIMKTDKSLKVIRKTVDK